MSDYLRVSLIVGCIVLSGCAHNRAVFIPDAKVVQGERQNTNPFLCSVEGFQQGNSYGIFEIEDGPTPAQGATLNGDLSGFGKRNIHNASSNESLVVKVIYHADDLRAIWSRLSQMGC